MMRHLNEGELRAYKDGELDEGLARSFQVHLESCASCQARFQVLLDRAERIQGQLESLFPRPAPTPPSTALRARLAERTSNRPKETYPMQKAFSRIPRPAWAGLLLALVLGVSLAFPSVRALAGSFLGIFRVQQVQVVPINANSLPQNLRSVGPSIQSLMAEDFSYQSSGQPETVTSAGEASKLAGFAVRLPSDTLGNPQITVQPGAQGTLKVDLARIQAILQEMGRTDVNLPASLNNATITVNVPASVASAYGACQRQETPASGGAIAQDAPPVYSGQDCTELIQLPSPTVSAPDSLDINQLGKEFLLMSGVPQADAERLSQTIDWTSTLVIPIPIGQANYQDVQVDGVSGVLIEQATGESSPHYLVVWVKNGIVYGLSGNGDSSAGLALANSLQ